MSFGSDSRIRIRKGSSDYYLSNVVIVRFVDRLKGDGMEIPNAIKRKALDDTLEITIRVGKQGINESLIEELKQQLCKTKISQNESQSGHSI